MRRSTHSTLRTMVGASVVVIAVAVPAGIAAAADYPGPSGSQVSADTGSTVKAATQSNTSTLPFTGGDVAGLTLIGAGAALAGVVLVRRSRRPAGV